MDERTLERIEDYLFGRMASEEQKSFEQEMETDEQLREWCHLVRISYDAAERDVERELREELQKIRERQNRRNKWFPDLLNIAAVLVPLLIATAYLAWAGQFDDRALYEQYYSPYTIEVMRSGADQTEQLQRASIKFQQGKYREALHQVEAVQPDDSLYQRSLLLKATILEGMGRTEQAIDVLEEVRSGTESLLSDKADWRLLLLYLKQSKREQFERLLEQITSEEHLYRSRAEQLKKDSKVPLRNVW